MSSFECVVYKGASAAGTYLYVPDREDALDEVPDALLQKLGELSEVIRLELSPERKLAHADTASVLKALEAQGFYLQLPPPREPSLAALLKPQEKHR